MKILQLIDWAKPGLAIDAGCASGYLAGDLTDRGWSVIGIEPDPISASQAKSMCAQVIQEPLETIDSVSLGPADVVIFGDVLEHLMDPSAVLTEFKSCLKSTGYVIVSVPNIANATVRAQLLFGRFDYTDKGILDRTHVRFFTRKSFRRFVIACGFNIDELVMTPIPIEEVWTSLKGPHWHWFLAVVNGLTTIAPGLLGYQMVARLSADEVDSR